jgi:hypothetical protein
MLGRGLAVGFYPTKPNLFPPAPASTGKRAPFSRDKPGFPLTLATRKLPIADPRSAVLTLHKLYKIEEGFDGPGWCFNGFRRRCWAGLVMKKNLVTTWTTVSIEKIA